MKDFVEALKNHLVVIKLALPQGCLADEIDAFASSWKPLPAMQPQAVGDGVWDDTAAIQARIDTSPKALQALAESWDEGFEYENSQMFGHGETMAEALRAVAAEKEAQAVPQGLSEAVDAAREMLPKVGEPEAVWTGIEARHLRTLLAAALAAASQAPECKTCSDEGSVGRPPDDYFPCPACTPRAPEASPCPQGCTTECQAKVHGCASECPALPWQPLPEGPKT